LEDVVAASPDQWYTFFDYWAGAEPVAPAASGHRRATS
jgi:predicted LPLAT superfamily acyltransferase